MFEINVKEKELYHKFPEVLNILLKDNTTKKNIIWATDSYENKGYKFLDQITAFSITNSDIIKPRSEKAKLEQLSRARDKGEVFTPSWMCNKQNNIIDSEWFEAPEVFNLENEDLTWTTITQKIVFPCNKSWQDYIIEIRLEITCGEAPYLVSRYDTVTGKEIEVKNRIGLLDRKFRILNENASNDEEWLFFALVALKSIYGFEWQGDNLLLARENILYTFIDNYLLKFNHLPNEEVLKEVATIISWNIIQMDGLKGVIPNSCKSEKYSQLTLFGEENVIECECVGCKNNEITKHNGIYSKTMDWNKNKKIRFVDALRRG